MYMYGLGIHKGNKKCAIWWKEMKYSKTKLCQNGMVVEWNEESNEKMNDGPQVERAYSRKGMTRNMSHENMRMHICRYAGGIDRRIDMKK